MGLQSSYFSFLQLFFIARSCHGIIIVMKLESAFFLMLGVVMGLQSSFFFFLTVVIWIARSFHGIIL
jgi:hypothetical protein